jgi:hypothetical protein
MSKKKSASRSKPVPAKKPAAKSTVSKTPTKKQPAKKAIVNQSAPRPSAGAASTSAPMPAATMNDRATVEAAINEMERQNTALDGLIDKTAGDDRTPLRRQQLALIGTITSLRARVVATDTDEYRGLTKALGESAAKIEAAKGEIAQVSRVISAVARVIDAATRLLALA